MALNPEYRVSHLAKGEDYDSAIARLPFDSFMVAREDEVLREIVQRHFPAGGFRYLDFACGTGRMTRVVSPYAGETLGIDISDSMVAVARSKIPGARFLVTDITQTPPDLGDFDLITAFRFLGNAQDELRIGALQALSRMLRPGGMLVVNNHRNPLAPRSFFRRMAGIHDGRELSSFRLTAMLHRAGLAIVEHRAVGWWAIRSQWATAESLASPVVRGLEGLSGLPGLHHLSPDMVLVARKAG